MRLFSIRPALTLRGRKFKGIRGWAGKPTHPPLTDFPIVCLVLAAAFDVISFVAEDGTAVARDYFVAATFVLVAGQIVALLTAITGFWDWWKGLDRDRSSGPIGRAQHTQVWRTTNWHAIVMVTAVVVNAVNIITRLADFDVAGATGLNLVLSLLGAGIIAFGALYGGALVYDYQFNVEPLKGSTAWDETEADQLPGDRTKPQPPAS
ncbi:MAG TPA: DUF2231 domain-containing protein [Actinomycetota bacterium]|nr:DUF2231 domain-containing protein [Actinomycetota bacterium]